MRLQAQCIPLEVPECVELIHVMEAGHSRASMHFMTFRCPTYRRRHSLR